VLELLRTTFRERLSARNILVREGEYSSWILGQGKPNSCHSQQMPRRTSPRDDR